MPQQRRRCAPNTRLVKPLWRMRRPQGVPLPSPSILALRLDAVSMPPSAVGACWWGISEVEAELLPEEKKTRVKALVQAGRMVAMLGDGINDAPALMEATVGVAMGSGTEWIRNSKPFCVGGLGCSSASCQSPRRARC